jgi:anaerobic selenocysteine-containing dehydrogenase
VSGIDRVRAALRRHDGPLTQELARRPGGFGLGQVPAAAVPDRVTSSICGYCSTGCSLDVHLRDGQAVNLTPTTEYPVNLGMACPKGWEALAPLRADDRATSPLARDRRGRLTETSWDEAAGRFVAGMRGVQQRHGAAATAFLSTGQIPTEEMALLGAFAKFGMGMLHGDGNTRQCMATAVTAYKESFGFDAPPYTYADLEASDVVVLVGSNLAVAHPILWQRLQRNRNDPELVVVDPRRTETAAPATQHLAVRPKTDLELLYGLGHLLAGRGAVDHDYVAAHTAGVERYLDHVAAYTPERVSAATGLSVEQLERCADTIADGRAVSFWWTMGVNQSHQGTRTAQAIIDLALLTGNLGRPGTGANSITGQCNAMGSRLFSNTASLLGGRDFADEHHRTEVADVLGIDAARIPHETSWSYDRIVEGIARGEIRALWVIATNGAHSWINQRDLHGLLDRLDLLVVQDLYADTETARRADIVLPAAAWGEKEGTFINSERRIARVHRVVAPPGEALPDLQIFRLIADAWGCADVLRELETPTQAFATLQELSRGRVVSKPASGPRHGAVAGRPEAQVPRIHVHGEAAGRPQHAMQGLGREHHRRGDVSSARLVLPPDLSREGDDDLPSRVGARAERAGQRAGQHRRVRPCEDAPAAALGTLTPSGYEPVSCAARPQHPCVRRRRIGPNGTKTITIRPVPDTPRPVGGRAGTKAVRCLTMS